MHGETDQVAAAGVSPEDGAAPAGRIAADQPWPSARSSCYTMFVLGVVVMFTILDRQVLALMIAPIKADFGISDTQAALLLGAAFSLTYALAGLPIARIADVANRRNLIAACIAFWSASTMACGLAQNYAHLFLSRLGIGIGEAGYAPATWSMVTDTFPREKVAFATGTIAIGGYVGSGGALILGGSVLALLAAFPIGALPVIGVLRPWQWTFVIVGLPGLLWALVVLTLREPPRRGVAAGQRRSVPAADVARLLWADWRTYTAVIGGMAVKSLMTMGTTQWMPTLFVRQFGWTLTQIGLWQGIVVLIAGPIGLVAGGKLSEYLHRRGMIDADLRIVFWALIVTVPLSVIFPLVADPHAMLALYGLNIFIASLGIGPGTASLQVITPNPMRAQVSAIYMFCMNVIGLALGPLIVALFTDYLFSNEQDLKYSISLCAITLGPITCLVVAQGLRPYRQSYANAMRRDGRPASKE
ncbi:MAG: MFS transporter [Sphingomonas fennica]